MPEEEKKRFGCFFFYLKASIFPKPQLVIVFKLIPIWKLLMKFVNNYCNWLFQLAEEEDRLQDLMNIQELELEDSEEFQVHCQYEKSLVCSQKIYFL